MNMKYFKILLTIVSCFVVKHIKAQDLRTEAKSFSLAIVSSYFSGNCDSFYNKLSSELWLMDGDGVVKIQDLKPEICEAMAGAVKNKEKTFLDYLNDFEIEILSNEEFKMRYDAPFPSYYIPAPDDYFFIGYQPKTTADELSMDRFYIREDMFIFMVRKENGVWKMKGTS